MTIGTSADVIKTKLVTKAGYDPVKTLGINPSRFFTSTPLSKVLIGSGGSRRLGIIFPYNPTLNLQGSVAYGQYDLTHTNYQPHFYTATQNQQITLGFHLTASTLEEADYMIGFMHFLRTITKMHYGKGDKELAGTPPPVLEFSSYGDYQFKNVPVLLRNYSFDQTGEYQYVNTSFNTQVPTFLTGFVDIITQYTPGKVLDKFTLKDFATGNLIKGGYV